MNQRLIKLCPYVWACCVFVLLACTGSKKSSGASEVWSEAHQWLQGIWLDDHTETPLMKVKGDTIYYAEPGTAPVAFRVRHDSLVTLGEQRHRYKIEKQTPHALWIVSEMGDVIRVHKAEDKADSLAFVHTLEVPRYETVEKKDSVVMFNNDRYHGYVYINPSQIKVTRPGVSDEGMAVENVYYDNIIHICVYKGRESLFAQDIRKTMFDGVVPSHFLTSAILSDMDFLGVDASGFHFQATVCIPDGAACYLVHLVATPHGDISYALVK